MIRVVEGIHPGLFEGRTLTIGGAPMAVLRPDGTVVSGTLPTFPAVINGIAARAYTVGQAVEAIDLRTRFSGATNYAVEPGNVVVTISGHELRFNTSAVLAETEFSVRGSNAAGVSAPIRFMVQIAAAVVPLPTITAASISPAGGPVGTLFTATATLANAISTTFQWALDGAIIPGATAASYASTAPGALTWTVAATNTAGTVEAVASAAVTAAQPVYSIEGTTVTVASLSTLAPLSIRIEGTTVYVEEAA